MIPTGFREVLEQPTLRMPTSPDVQLTRNMKHISDRRPSTREHFPIMLITKHVALANRVRAAPNSTGFWSSRHV